MTATMTTATIWGTDAWIDMWSGFRHPLQEPGTLPERVQNVFSYNLTVNFPLITEICELAEQRPYEIAEMLRILASALRENANSKLKVFESHFHMSICVSNPITCFSAGCDCCM